MSAGGQGQGKNLCCFHAPLKSMRRVLAAPGSSPSLPGPHAGPERSRNTRRVPVMYTERTTARRRPWVPRGKRRASLTISTHGELLTGSTSTAGAPGARWASGTWMDCPELSGSRSIAQGICRAQRCSRKSPPLFPPSRARGPLARQQGDCARACAARRTRTLPRCEVVGVTSGVWPEAAPQPSTHYRPPTGGEGRWDSRRGNQKSSCVCHDLPSLVWCGLGLGLAENDITTSMCPYFFFFLTF